MTQAEYKKPKDGSLKFVIQWMFVFFFGLCAWTKFKDKLNSVWVTGTLEQFSFSPLVSHYILLSLLNICGKICI